MKTANAMLGSAIPNNNFNTKNFKIWFMKRTFGEGVKTSRNNYIITCT